MTNIMLFDYSHRLRINLFDIITMIVILVAVFILSQPDMNCEEILSSGHGPTVEVIDALDTRNTHQVFSDVICSDWLGCGFHQDVIALFEHVHCCEKHYNWEYVCAYGVNDFVLRPELNDDGSYDDSDRLE